MKRSSLPQTISPLQSAPGDLKSFYYLLRDQSWIVVVCMLLAALATATYLVRTPRIYAAKSVLQVEQEEAKVLNIQRVQQEDLQTLEFLKTVEQTLQNRALIERVIDENKLLDDPRLVAVGLPKPTRERLAARVAKLIDVRLRKGTRLIDVTVEHTDPAVTALIANSLVQEFMRLNHEHNSSASEDATSFLSKEAQQLKQKLETSENALQAYKE